MQKEFFLFELVSIASYNHYKKLHLWYLPGRLALHLEHGDPLGELVWVDMGVEAAEALLGLDINIVMTEDENRCLHVCVRTGHIFVLKYAVIPFIVVAM